MNDIESILDKMSKEVDKSKTYLKGLFNTADADYKEQFGDTLSDERRILMSLTKVGRKYGLQRQEIEHFAGMEDAPAYALEEAVEAEESSHEQVLKEAEESTIEIFDDVNHGEKPVDISSGSGSAWKRFLAAIPDPVKPKKDFVKIPSLIVEIGPTYYLKMTDLSAGPPDPIEQDGKWGAYTVYPLKVTFMKVSDEDLYDIKYKSGNFEGKDAFVDNTDYTLWLNEKSMGQFKLFWLKVTPDGEPDDRVFTYKFTKKGKYNNYTYGIPKKR